MEKNTPIIAFPVQRKQSIFDVKYQCDKYYQVVEYVANRVNCGEIGYYNERNNLTEK